MTKAFEVSKCYETLSGHKAHILSWDKDKRLFSGYVAAPNQRIAVEWGVNGFVYECHYTAPLGGDLILDLCWYPRPYYVAAPAAEQAGIEYADSVMAHSKVAADLARIAAKMDDALAKAAQDAESDHTNQAVAAVRGKDATHSCDGQHKSAHDAKPKGWIGVDLDGTLAEYDHWRGPAHIGKPVPAILNFVKEKLAAGIEVRVFTARVWRPEEIETTEDEIRAHEAHIASLAIQEWTKQHLGVALEATCQKDMQMIACIDDRAVGVLTNKGLFLWSPGTGFDDSNNGAWSHVRALLWPEVRA